MMKIKSLHSIGKSLTYGKIYDVVGETSDEFKLLDDEHYNMGYSKKYFEIVKVKKGNLIDNFCNVISEIQDSEFNKSMIYIYKERFKQSIFNAFEAGQENPNVSAQTFYNENFE